MAGKAKTKIVGGERIDLGTGQPFVPETITSDSLTPQVGFNIPPVSNAAPDAAGLQGSLSAVKDQFTQQRIKASEEARTAKDTSLSALLDSLKDSPGEVALTSEKYSESVDPLQKETTDLENQLDAEQRALENQMRDIEDAGGGLVSGQNIELQRVRGNSLRRQADIAVILKAKSGQLADARAIADRAISAQLEQQRQRNDILTLVYNENKSLFDKEEQRQFEVQMSDRQRELDNEEYRLRAEFEQKIKQSDPLYQLEVALKSTQLGQEKAKLSALTNPDPNVIDSQTLKEVQGLSDGARRDLVNATDTIGQLERIKELVANNSVDVLANPFSEEGRLYARLTTDIADKMARERTGAVVRDEEQRSFKRILGVGLFNQAVASPEEINAELDKFIELHTNSSKLVDPTGKIRNYLGVGGASSSADPLTSYTTQANDTINNPLGNWLGGLGYNLSGN